MADDRLDSSPRILSSSSTHGTETLVLLPEAPMEEFGMGTAVDVTGCEIPAYTTYFGLTDSLVPQI